VKKWTKFIILFVIIGLIGTAWHFLYKWLNESVYVKFLFNTNESIFEHLKMFFYPIMIVSLIQVSFVEKDKSLFLASRLYGCLFSLVWCVAFYYVYKTNAPKVSDVVFITSYFVFLFLGLYVSSLLYNHMPTMPEFLRWLAFFIALAILVCFIYYSYKPLDTEFFKVLKM